MKLQNSPETISSEEVSSDVEVGSEENEVSIDELKDQEASEISETQKTKISRLNKFLFFPVFI